MGLSSDPSSSHFQTLLDAALRDYEKQTGTKLADHPLAQQLENCDSVESVTAVLQRQAPSSNKFRGDDSKAMKSLKRGVHVLHMLSASTLLGEGVGLVRRTEARLWVFFWFMVLITFTCRFSHPRGRYLLALPYYLPYVSSSINICGVVTQVFPGGQRRRRERRRARRPTRVYRTLPKPPRNLYQSSPDGTHVRDTRQNHGGTPLRHRSGH